MGFGVPDDSTPGAGIEKSQGKMAVRNETTNRHTHVIPWTEEVDDKKVSIYIMSWRDLRNVDGVFHVSSRSTSGLNCLEIVFYRWCLVPVQWIRPGFSVDRVLSCLWTLFYLSAH